MNFQTVMRNSNCKTTSASHCVYPADPSNSLKEADCVHSLFMSI